METTPDSSMQAGAAGRSSLSALDVSAGRAADRLAVRSLRRSLLLLGSLVLVIIG